jgi:hypothetical protein
MEQDSGSVAEQYQNLSCFLIIVHNPRASSATVRALIVLPVHRAYNLNSGSYLYAA